jgi:hypothetical protein
LTGELPTPNRPARGTSVRRRLARVIAAVVVSLALAALAATSFHRRFLAEPAEYILCRDALRAVTVGQSIDEARRNVRAAMAGAAPDKWQTRHVLHVLEHADEWEIACNRYGASAYWAKGPEGEFDESVKRPLLVTMLIAWSRVRFADDFDQMWFRIGFKDGWVIGVQRSECTDWDDVLDCQIVDQ